MDKQARYRDFWGSSLVVNDRLKARIEQICMKIGISQSSALICIEKIRLIQYITVNPTYMSGNEDESDFFYTQK